MVTDLEGGVVLGGLCDKNCFCCPFEDCISDEMDYEDYIEEKRIDKYKSYFALVYGQHHEH